MERYLNHPKYCGISENSIIQKNINCKEKNNNIDKLRYISG